MDNLPYADDIIKKPSSTPSELPFADDVIHDPSHPKPFEGPFADWFYSKTAVGRVLDAVNQGANDAWGAIPWTISKENEESLRKSGWWNKSTDIKKNFFKTANEAFMRSTANAVLPLAHLVATPLSGIASGISQFGEELSEEAKANYKYDPLTSTLVGGLGELIGSSPERIPEHFIPPSSRIGTVNKARANRIIGESRPVGAEPTESQLIERAKATGNLGDHETAFPDVDQTARELNPRAFKAYDEFLQTHEGLKEELKQAVRGRAEDPRVIAAQEEIDTILGKVKGLEDKLTKKSAARLQEVREGLDAFLQTDTPAMIEAKKALSDNAQKLIDTRREVNKVYAGAKAYVGPGAPVFRDRETAPEWLQQLMDETKPPEEAKGDWLDQLIRSVKEDTELPTALEKPVEAPLASEAPAPSATVEQAPTALKTAPEGSPAKAEDVRIEEAQAVQPKEVVSPFPSKPFKEKPSVVDKAGNILIDNIEDFDDVKQVFKYVYEKDRKRLDLTRNKFSDQDRIDLAESAGLSSSQVNLDLLKRLFVDSQIPLSARVEGVKRMLTGSLQKIYEAAEKGDVQAFINAEGAFLDTSSLVDVAEVELAARAEAGRTLRVFRQRAKLLGTAKEVEATLQLGEGNSLSVVEQKMQAIRELKTPKEIADLLQKAKNPSFGEMYEEFVTNSFISGFVGNGLNLLGNAAFTLQHYVAETPTASLIGYLHEKIAGKPIERVRAREALEGVYSLVSGQENALMAYAKSLEEGRTALLPGEEWSPSAGKPRAKEGGPFPMVERTKNIPGIAGSALRIPSERVMAPIDSYFRTLNFTTERSKLIMRKAFDDFYDNPANAGKSAAQADKEIKASIYNLEKNTPYEIVKQARDQANELTLMGPPGDPTKRLLVLTNLQAELPFIGRIRPLKPFIPFVRSIGQLYKLGVIDRTPLGLLNNRIRADLTGKNGTIVQHQAIAKMLIGSTIFMGLGTYLDQKYLTPGPAQDYKEAFVNSMVDGQPYGLKIGNESVQVNRLGVPGLQIALAADFGHFLNQSFLNDKVNVWDGLTDDEKDQLGKATSAYIWSLGQTFIDGSMFGTISDINKVTADPERYGQSFINSLPSYAVPFSVFQAQLAQQMDPYQRQVRSVAEALYAKIPGLSETLEPKVDIFGNPVPNKSYYGLYVTHISNDPAWKVLKDVEYFPAPVDRKINGIELTSRQYTDYSMMSGQLFHDLWMKPHVEDQEWMALSNEDKKKSIAEGLAISRTQARAWLLLQPGNQNIPADAAEDLRLKSQGIK